MFIVIEGGDGVGKTTQAQLLANWIGQQGFEVLCCRDPGSTPLGEAVRSILLDRHDLHIVPMAEMLLYMTARAQMVVEVIRPAIEAGKVVVCDRFLLSTVAYQGYGGGIDPRVIWQVGQVAVQETMPELTIVLDLPVEQALARLQGEADRIESRGHEFFRRVRHGFLEEAKKRPTAITVVSAEGSVEEVFERIKAVVRPRLASLR